MLPPKASGTSVLRTSDAAGATPMVPWNGSSGSATWQSESSASKTTVRAAASIR
jgi:hypothetical protein